VAASVAAARLSTRPLIALCFPMTTVRRYRRP
jgi:hypothetical protein